MAKSRNSLVRSRGKTPGQDEDRTRATDHRSDRPTRRTRTKAASRTQARGHQRTKADKGRDPENDKGKKDKANPGNQNDTNQRNDSSRHTVECGYMSVSAVLFLSVPFSHSSDFFAGISFLFSVLVSPRHFLEGGMFRSIGNFRPHRICP